MPNYASDGKVVEFQNTPEAAQAMLHLSLEKVPNALDGFLAVINAKMAATPPQTKTYAPFFPFALPP